MNRFKSGIENLKDEAVAECLNSLTKTFVKMAIGSVIGFFILGVIFADEETNENK